MKTHLNLAEIRQRTTNHYAGWWTILGIDPIAYRVVWVLHRVSPNLNPNVLTTCSLIAGIGAALALAQRHYLAGGVLYEVAFLFDCLDGKMARLQGRSSRFGGFFDGLVNIVVYAAGLVGLACSDLGNRALLGGVLGALVVHLVAIEQAHFQQVHGGASSHREPSDDVSVLARLRENKPLMWPDRHLCVFLVCPVLGLAAYGVLANLAVDIVLQVRRFFQIRKSTAGRDGS